MEGSASDGSFCQRHVCKRAPFVPLVGVVLPDTLSLHCCWYCFLLLSAAGMNGLGMIGVCGFDCGDEEAQ